MQATFFPQSCPQLGLPNNGWFSVGFMTKILFAFLVSVMGATWPHLIPLMLFDIAQLV